MVRIHSGESSFFGNLSLFPCPPPLVRRWSCGAYLKTWTSPANCKDNPANWCLSKSGLQNRWIIFSETNVFKTKLVQLANCCILTDGNGTIKWSGARFKLQHFPTPADAFPMARSSWITKAYAKMATARCYAQAAGRGTGPEIKGRTSESVESMVISSWEPENRQGSELNWRNHDFTMKSELASKIPQATVSQITRTLQRQKLSFAHFHDDLLGNIIHTWLLILGMAVIIKRFWRHDTNGISTNLPLLSAKNCIWAIVFLAISLWPGDHVAKTHPELIHQNQDWLPLAWEQSHTMKQTVAMRENYIKYND